MRKPTTVERGYLDFDGFFASCEQFAHPELRGKPVGVIPMVKGSTCVIACSREAKARGIGNLMPPYEAKRICPEIILQPQNPDLYRRCHNELISEIMMVAPVDAVKSIDELTFRLDPGQMHDPEAVGIAIKRRIASVVGPWINCSIGYGANRLLAKMACKDSKPAGNLPWHPDDTDAILSRKALSDVPGIGANIAVRLEKCGITTMAELLRRGPRELRAVWHSVTGERMWYALHGYDIQAQPSKRGQFGHGRVLPPQFRKPEGAREITRMLTVMSCRRMRREGFRAGWLFLGIDQVSNDKSAFVSRSINLPEINDYRAGLLALDQLWVEARPLLNPSMDILRVNVWFSDLTGADKRQLDLLLDDDDDRQGQEAISTAMDNLNHRYGRTVVSLGEWRREASSHMGAKISYTRIPRREDGR